MNRRGCSPTRYCKRMGVTTRYFDPSIGAGIADLIRPETSAILLESPGSLTFEIRTFRRSPLSPGRAAW